MKHLPSAAALLTALVQTAQAEQVVFSEVMYHPPAGGYEYVEVQNLTATPFDIARWKLSGGADFTFPDFNGGAPLETFLKAFERIVICNTDPASFRSTYNVPASVRIFGPWTGVLSNGGERINLKDKNGVPLCTLSYDDRAPWPLEPDGAGQSLNLTDTSFAIDDYRVWTSGAPTPGFSPILVAEESFPNPEVNLSTGIPYIEYADSWNFHDQNTNLGTAWKDTAYNYIDAGWTLVGAAGNNGGLYGFESSALPAPGIQTPLLDSATAANHITYYFRKEFNYDGNTTGATVTIDLINDDSAYFYLNGSPIGGQRLGPNPDWKTTSTGTVNNAVEELAAVTHNGTALVTGTNVLCAEVHQVNDSSSDCVFGARMSIAAPTNASIVINEVLPSVGGFIEFFNPSGSSIDIGGWYLTDDPGNLTKYQIPGSLPIPSSGFGSIDFVDAFPAIPANTIIYLTEDDGSTVANAINAAIPLDGRSLGRKGDGSSSWFLFSETTRDTPNTSASSELNLKINEVRFDSVGTTVWIELFNPSTISLAASGLSLASFPDFANKVPLTGNISPSGYATFPIQFPGNGSELTLFLVNASSHIVDSAVLRHAAPREYSAAFPDGSDNFFASSAGSQGLTNDPDRETGIVITELMVDPPTGHRDGEYIELFNKSGSSIDLSGWEFEEGVNFTFPPGTSLSSGAYLVIAANKDFTSNAHPSANVVGQFEGELANGGELLRLVDDWGNLADEVHYHTGGSWPFLAGGLGSSLELKHPDMDNAMATAWADSDESNKSSFQTYTLTELFENITTRGSVTDYEELHLQATGDAHIALRNLSLTRNGTSSNILPGGGNTVSTNGSGAAGWLCQGTHYASTQVGNEFHLISDGHGDVKANRCEIDVTQIQDNDLLTFTFDARWISGKPTLLVETWDRSFGGIFHFPVPDNLGTPGATNSSALALAAPTITGLIHSPAVPTSSDPVKITARISDAESVNIVHRLDNSAGNGPWNTSPMFDDGLNGGDETANDGIYSASLTNYQADNAIVQFYVEATSPGGTTIQPRPAPDKPAMWVVDNTIHATDLRRQRFVISARDANASGAAGDSTTFDYAFPRLSNHYFNTTFIGDDQEIIYNCEMRKSGSPWTRPGGADFARLKWKTPGDRRFRGYSKRAVDNDAGGAKSYHNRIIRYWLYLFGHAANENEFIRVIINGGNADLREDVEPNATDFLKRNWEDGQKGELYRIDDEWWFDDGWGRQNRNATWEYKNTTEPERYSSEWIKRSREAEYDYSSFISWTQMVGTNSFTREELERTADIDLMAANAVVRGWCDDWDTLTRTRGKNGYFLRRATDGKWMLIQWDSDNTFANVNAPFIGNLAGVQNFYSKPYVQQRVNHYLHEMVTKYTANSSRLSAWFQCEEEASTSYTANESTYNNWNANRLATANSTIGTAVLNTNFDVTTGNGSSTTTSADTITLNGTSGENAFAIRAIGHPEASYSFTSTTAWTLTGIQLRQGINSIIVEALDQEGKVVSSETFTVNKTGNALPVVVLNANPGSFNAPVTSIFELDATSSYDPEGTPLSFTWSPPGSVTMTNPTPSSAHFSFNVPGHYHISLNVTDAGGASTIVNREVVVYAESGRDPFSNRTLASFWSLENLALRNGSTPPASYSLDDVPNSLALKVEEDSAKPLSLTSPTHPILWRGTPGTTDWSFATDLVLASVQQGDFYTGVIIEGSEGGSAVRYTIGLEDGDFLRAKRTTSSGTTQLASIAWTAKDAVIRIRRTGTQLFFEWREAPGIWTQFHSRSFAAAATTSRAGLFAATDTLQSLRVEFDYGLLVDPDFTSPTLQNLRLTEIMYHPTGGSLAEFLEFKNIGSTPLVLSSVTLDDTHPFGAFTFSNVTLAPGQYGVIVADETSFRSEYGATPLIIGQWAGGNLSNGGENIIVRDPLSNIIHDFDYDDVFPWPVEADGQGPSLEVIDTEGDYSDPLNWRASAFTDGSPGQEFAVDIDNDGLSDIQESALGTDPNRPDSDGDGFIDSHEAAAGTNPLDSNSFLKILSVLPGINPNEYVVTWSSIPGKVYTVEINDTLTGNWIPLASLTATDTTSFLTDSSLLNSQFYRIKVSTN